MSTGTATAPATALVTGASRGIGRAVAHRLAAEGTRVALCARDAHALHALEEELSGAVALPADLGEPAAVERLVERAVDRLGELEALVSCAGVARYARVGDVSREELEQQLAINFVAPFMMAQAAAEHMAERGGGVIVSVASTLGLKPAPLTAAYAATKAALVSMTRSLALELGPAGVRVNAVAPGVVDTDMVRQPRPTRSQHPSSVPETEARVRERLETLRGQHLLQRLGTPEEVAEAVLYLLRAPFVTGEVLVVDGGLLLGG